MKKLDETFYNRDTVAVARELLGKLIVRQWGNGFIAGRIVETEAYLGVEDKASHVYGGRRTERVEVIYGPPGRAYVFMIYGIHNCFNVVTREVEVPEAVLIRAIEPVTGLDVMAQNRFGKKFSELTKRQCKQIGDGPGKLCRALAIDRTHNGANLTQDALFLADDGWREMQIVVSKRIGIDYAGEAAAYPLRFNL